jgi:hypothetical protein
VTRRRIGRIDGRDTTGQTWGYDGIRREDDGSTGAIRRTGRMGHADDEAGEHFSCCPCLVFKAFSMEIL